LAVFKNFHIYFVKKKQKRMDNLTAKLEKLEQKITLTLQEIDYNFSACHHRVTTKVLPQMMRYGELSEEIFNNSQVRFFNLYM